jgi:hypothetical protein
MAAVRVDTRSQMGNTGGRPRNEDTGAELRDSLKALNRVRSRDVQDGIFNALEAQDTRGPASQTWTTRQGKILEDALFCIGGLTLTMDALEGFLHRPAVRRMVDAIDTGQASLQQRLVTNASTFLTELLAATGSRCSEDDNALRVLICALVDPAMEEDRQITTVAKVLGIRWERVKVRSLPCAH